MRIKLLLPIILFFGVSFLPQQSYCDSKIFQDVPFITHLAADGLSADHCPLVADPKLTDGRIPIRFYLTPPSVSYHLTIWVLKGHKKIRLICNEIVTGSLDPLEYHWDGQDSRGRFVDPGKYKIVIIAAGSSVSSLLYEVNIVRLGITQIQALPSISDDEWQMVYFRKNGDYEFFATPDIHEYVNQALPGDMSDLDLNDGSPRPIAPLHTILDEPVMDGSSYATDSYNYPVCYLKGVDPKFLVTMGSTCTSSRGFAVDAGYPLTDITIRGVAHDPAGSWDSYANNIVPGGSYTYVGTALPNRATRTDRPVTWSWQYRQTGDILWTDIPGYMETQHRFYTVINTPYWSSGASGTQYSGPWVEVADYLFTFSEALTIDTSDETGVLNAFIKGYFGQNGPLTTAIEGVMYDTYAVGGDSGGTHYYQSGSRTIRLTRFLNAHALGVYINCSDVASTTSTMLGMLGVQNVRMVRLGEMFLRAIWGIGCPDYTLDLWDGHRIHRFNYHHVISRDDGISLSDACMWLDDDGDPDTLPGLPGYNCDRPWIGPEGYNALSSTNDVSLTLDVLPYIQ